MKDNKNNIEMIIYVSDLTLYRKGINELIELDLMNPAESKSKYEDFKKANEGHKFFISDTSMQYELGVSEFDSIEWLLEWAEEYLQGWSEEQIMIFSDIIYELDWDWDDASEKVKNYDYVLIEIGDCETDEECVGRYYAECLDIPNSIVQYFDYVSYGRNILEENDSVTTDEYVLIVY